MGSTLTCSPLSRKLARRVAVRQMSGLVLDRARRLATDRRRLCPIGRARKARGNDLRDSDGQQDESDESQTPERRVATKRAREDETEKLQRHNASADYAQTNANISFLGAMPLGLKRKRHRRRV